MHSASAQFFLFEMTFLDKLETDCPPKKANILRDSTGRFTSNNLSSLPQQQKARYKREHLRKRGLLKEHIFEEYIHGVCCKGNGTDFLEASRSGGALVSIFEALISPTFRLGRNRRSKRLHEHYVETMCSSREKTNELSQATQEQEAFQRPSTITMLHRPLCKPKKYKCWRLPLMSRRKTELAGVKRWLEFAFREKAVLSKTIPEALSLCASLISAHQEMLPKTIAGKSTCLGCVARKNLSLLCGGCSASFKVKEPEEGVSLQADDAFDSVRSLSSSTKSAVSHGLVTPSKSSDQCTVVGSFEKPGDKSQNSNTSAPQFSFEEKRTRENTLSLIDMAKNDVVFMLLASLFDENRSAIFGLFAGDFLKKLESSNKVPTTLLQEVLMHAKCQRWGIPDEQRHKSRETSLRATLRLMQAFRVASGLKSFEELRWSFVDQAVALNTPVSKRFSL